VTFVTPERFGLTKVTATHIILRCCGLSYGYPYHLICLQKRGEKILE
jgi:hypothetical protein